MLLNLSIYDEKLLNGTNELAKLLHGQEIGWFKRQLVS